MEARGSMVISIPEHWSLIVASNDVSCRQLITLRSACHYLFDLIVLIPVLIEDNFMLIMASMG